MKPPEEGSSEEEASESPATEQAEQHTETKVPEEFERKVDEIIQSATMPELDYIKSQAMQRESQIKHSEGKAGKGAMFDTEGME